MIPADLEATLRRLSPEDQQRALNALRVLRRGYRTNHYLRGTRPNLHPKQEFFLSMDCRELMTGGAAGGSKSDMLLLGALQYFDVPGYSALILRRNWPDLAQKGAIMDRCSDWMASFPGVRPRDQGRRFESPEGGTISFGHVENMKDAVNKYQSAEFQFIAFDEVTQHDSRVYLYLFSRLRRLQGVSIPLRMRSGTNPGGTYGQAYKERFVSASKAVSGTWLPPPDDPAREDGPRSLQELLDVYDDMPHPCPEHEYLDVDEDTQFSWLWCHKPTCTECHGSGKMHKSQTARSNGKTDCVYCEGRGISHCYFLPARLQDNPSLDQDEYRRSLILLPPTERLQLERGRWDVSIEGHLFRESWICNFEFVRGEKDCKVREKPPTSQDALAKLLRKSSRAFSESGGLKVYRRSTPNAQDWLNPDATLTTEEKIDWVPMERLQVFSTADTASKDDSHNDYTAICVWGLDIQHYDLYLFHVLREKFEVPDILPAILRVHQEWPCDFCIIEDAASGIGVIQSAQRQQGRGLTVLPYSPHVMGRRTGTNAKVSRATVSMIRMRNGKVFFPTPRPYWWGDFISELLMFGTEEWTRLQIDDQVDSFSMASWFAANRDYLVTDGPAATPIQKSPPAYGVVPVYNSESLYGGLNINHQPDWQ
jgi:predicted phage terminase large subunit-like protein